MHDPSSENDDDLSATINVTPFVDVVLVLLVIFMVTTRFTTPQAIEVDLPSAASGGELAPTTLNLVLSRAGNVSLDGQEVDRAHLETELARRARATQKPQVVIAADRGVDYGRVIELIDLVKAHGIEHFALQIDRS
jgi:biopolymer transport protein ExbD